jgi:outer membrane receptor protein involved in Fe transport
MLLNPAEGTLVPLEAAVLPPVLSVQQSNTETMELGWTGILDQRLKITADIYFTRQNDFVSPLLVQTPLVTLNGQDVAGFITGPIVSAITQQLIAAGLDPATAQARAQEQAAGIVPELAEGIATVPLGVVSSPEISGGSDVVVTYRNVGDLDLWGSDLALQWFLDDAWTLNGTYSYISDDLFEIEDGAPIALNAPQHKGTLGLSYRNLRQGFNAEARVRFRSSFPAISAGFEGDVPGAELLDLTLGYSVPGTPATVQLAVNNVFDTPYQSFVGVPDIGRFALLRVKYDLF